MPYQHNSQTWVHFLCVPFISKFISSTYKQCKRFNTIMIPIIKIELHKSVGYQCRESTIWIFSLCVFVVYKVKSHGFCSFGFRLFEMRCCPRAYCKKKKTIDFIVYDSKHWKSWFVGIERFFFSSFHRKYPENHLNTQVFQDSIDDFQSRILLFSYSKKYQLHLNIKYMCMNIKKTKKSGLFIRMLVIVMLLN